MAELNITNDYKHNAFLSNYQSYDTSGTMFDDTSFSEPIVESQMKTEHITEIPKSSGKQQTTSYNDKHEVTCLSIQQSKEHNFQK